MPAYQSDEGRTRWTRVVYVIELAPGACEEKKSPCGGTSCGRTPIYVGQTALTAEDRFAQHMAGVKASKWVMRYGLKLRPDLAVGYTEMDTLSESETAEAALAQTMRDVGSWCVYGGH